MSEKEAVMAKINQVIAGALQFEEEQFRLILESLVKRGGKDAEMLIIQHITATNVPHEIRENIIRCTGYIQSNLYLVPLKKIIDQEPRLNLKKAAIISLAKYNNQRALNILNQCLQSVANPYLLKTVNEQISMIKKNNPILSMLPKFLMGDEDKKSFMTVMNILKKILKPGDATVFINYLRHDNIAIRSGSFDILCNNGDKAHQQYIFDYFYQRLMPDPAKPDSLPPATEEEYLHLAKHVKHFFIRFPNFILTQLRRLSGLYQFTTDQRIKDMIVSVYCHSHSPQALMFIKDIYETAGPELREFIIEESAGNELAVEFLFEKYQAGQLLKDKVIKALLNSHKGFDYFSTHFMDFEPQVQELIVKSLPDSIKPQMVGFIKMLFKSDLSHLKIFLLKRVRDNYLYGFKDILFDSDRLDELLKLERDYLITISMLFPIETIKMLLEKMAADEPEVARMKRYFTQINEILANDVAISLNDSTLMELLVLKVVNSSSLDLNGLLLTFLEKINTLSRETYKGLYDAFNLFTIQRGDNLVEEETYAQKRVMDNFKNIIEDIKKVDALEKEVRTILAKSIPDLIQLRRVLETYHIGMAFKVETLTQALAERFMQVEEKYINHWRDFFKGFPIITQLVKEERLKLANPDGVPAEGSYHDQLRIVIKFEEKYLTALFNDQLKELIPKFRVAVDALQLEPTDILLCDSTSLKDYINKKQLGTSRIFVLLENRSEFGTFKAYNPKSFTRPVSVYRAVKLMLQELYLIR